MYLRDRPAGTLRGLRANQERCVRGSTPQQWKIGATFLQTLEAASKARDDSIRAVAGDHFVALRVLQFGARREN
jgi:hypothetical protein